MLDRHHPALEQGEQSIELVEELKFNLSESSVQNFTKLMRWVSFYSARIIENFFQAQTHRLTPWIRREIVALYGSTDRRYLNDLIIDIQHQAIELGIESRQFREFLTHHMHNYATHFIHELKGFASAKEYDIRSYDRNARYAPAKRMGTRRNPQTETPGAPERIMPIDDPDDPTPILIEDDDEQAPGPSGIGRRNTNRQPRRRTTTNDFETLVLDQEDLPPFAPDFPVVDWDDPALDGHSTDSSNADGDAETPPRLEPEFSDRPGTSSLNRQPPQRRQGIQMARVSNIPIGDSNPLLNPVNIPIHPREGRGHAFLPHRRQRPMNTIASRIYNEMQNRREVVDTIVIGRKTIISNCWLNLFLDDDSPAPRRPVVHRSRLELEIESRQQVIDLVNSSDDEEAVNSPKPNRSSDAFNPARSPSSSRIPKRQNTTEENREAIVILSESDNESDIECVTPQQKRPRYSFHDCSYDPEDIDQPGPSSLNYL